MTIDTPHTTTLDFTDDVTAMVFANMQARAPLWSPDTTEDERHAAVGVFLDANGFDASAPSPLYDILLNAGVPDAPDAWMLMLA